MEVKKRRNVLGAIGLLVASMGVNFDHVRQLIAPNARNEVSYMMDNYTVNTPLVRPSNLVARRALGYIAGLTREIVRGPEMVNVSDEDVILGLIQENQTEMGNFYASLIDNDLSTQRRTYENE